MPLEELDFRDGMPRGRAREGEEREGTG